METTLRLEIDGHSVSAETLWSIASGQGHFTAMQVRDGGTRGLSLHLDRLEAANRELFDADFDGEGVRHLIRHALGDDGDASLRVYVFEAGDEPAIMVTVRPPGGVATPQRLQSVRYQRPDAHLKHLATGQGFYTRLARRNGFDDALLTGADGVIAESATANICFFDGARFVWPDAPQLRGITMQLLEHRLAELGVASAREPVSLQNVGSFAGSFLTNARGVAALSHVDETQLPIAGEQLELLADAFASVPWERI
jgi:branched-subunit amino acid aminotransferase/4-amino-4-deoxychorismate lyase